MRAGELGLVLAVGTYSRTVKLVDCLLGTAPWGTCALEYVC
jgi:hypothetical protein